MRPRQGESRLQAGGVGSRCRGGRQPLRSWTKQPMRSCVIPVQILIGVSAWWSSETHRGEAKAGQAAAGTGDHLLLVQRVAAARAERRGTGRVAGRRVVAVVVGGCGASVGGAVTPSLRSIHDHVVVVQMRKRRQAWGPVGDGRPPTV